MYTEKANHVLVTSKEIRQLLVLICFMLQLYVGCEPGENEILLLIIKNIPGIAFTDNSVSAKCCHLFEKDGEAREAGKVKNTTAFEDRTILFKDLMKESISHSYNVL